MKKPIALALALLLLLPGCAAMLERDYTLSSPHQEDPPPHGEDAYRVETYPALRSALLSYVEEGMTDGLLRFPTTYAGNLSVDMEKAKRQLMEEEPLGCYALADVTWRTSKIIAYYEVELEFTYKLDRADFVSLPKVRSQSELAHLLAETVTAGEDRVSAFLTACPEDAESFFAAALAETWETLYPAPADEEEPLDPPPMPGLEGTCYPASGSRRVAVLTLTEPAEETPTEGEEAPAP